MRGPKTIMLALLTTELWIKSRQIRLCKLRDELIILLLTATSVRRWLLVIYLKTSWRRGNFLPRRHKEHEETQSFVISAQVSISQWCSFDQEGGVSHAGSFLIAFCEWAVKQSRYMLKSMDISINWRMQYEIL